MGSRLQYEKYGNTKLWFFYDSDGNPSGLRYQNGTSAPQDYYFACNWRGDVTNIYDSNGNELAKYSYDAWGNMASVTDPSGNAITDENHIANINPIRYRGYYFDSETGFYYISSRYFDSDIGRFISADTTDVLDVQDDLCDKNLYAYCDNNSVMRMDSGGTVWHLAIGAAVGVATQFIADVGIGLSTGSSFREIISSLSPVDYVSAAIGGAIAASGIGAIGAIATNAALGGATYVANCGYNKVQVNKKDFFTSTVIGGVSGAIGGRGANGKNMRGVYSRSKQVINTTKSARKKAMYTAKITEIKKSIAISTGRTFFAGVVSNTGNFLRKWFTKSKA